MSHLPIRPKPHLSSFRRMAIGAWKTVGDPSVYGSVRLRMGQALAYLKIRTPTLVPLSLRRRLLRTPMEGAKRRHKGR